MSKQTLRPLQVFLLGLIIAFAALSPAILPYGFRYVTRGDFIEQQLPFLLEARRILRSGLDTYSFNTFLGAPSIGSYAFYTLGSPFVWPLALLPKAALPSGIAVMALLKHAVCLLISWLYLKRMVKDARLALIGAVLYTFSSFTIVNTQFYHFTEVIAFFPLLLSGMEDIASERSNPALLVLACFINTLTNYYFMLGSALMAALYFLVRFFSPDWKDRRHFSFILYTVFCCAVGCAMAGFLLLPAMWHMLTITRTGASNGSQLTSLYPLPVLLERVRSLLMPIESNVVHAYYGDAASWTSTAACLPLFGACGAAAFLLQKNPARWLSVLLLLLFVFSLFPVLNGAFVLYSNVNYTRWWYGLSLFLSLATLFALKEADLSSLPWRRAFFLCLGLVLLLTVPFLLPSSLFSADSPAGRLILHRRTEAYAPPVFRWYSVLLALLQFVLLLYLLLRPHSLRKILAFSILTAVIHYASFIAVNDAFLLSGGEKTGEGSYTLSEIAVPTLQACREEDETDFRRIDYSRMLRNYGLLRGTSSVTVFHSLRSSYVGRFISMAGFGYDESTTVFPPGTDSALRSFLSVTEYHALLPEDPVPDGFVYDREEDGHSVYRNPDALPMGFLADTYTGTYDQPMNPDTLGLTLLAAVTLDDPMQFPVTEKMNRLDVRNIPEPTASIAVLRENACDSFVLSPSGFDAHITCDSDGIVVFTIPYDKGFEAWLDGEKTGILLCDVSFMGIPVSAGSHTLHFTFHNRGFRSGLILSCMAFLAFLGILLQHRRARNRIS